MPINNKIKSLYDALKADGGDVGSEQEFQDWFLAKGEQGYKNRKYVYDTFKADGADIGESYDEFRDWLGLHVHGTNGQNVQDRQSMQPYDGDFTMRESELEKGNSQQSTGNSQQSTGNSQQTAKPAKTQPSKPNAAPITTPNIPSLQQMMDNRPQFKPVMQSEVGLDANGNRVMKPKAMNVHVPGTPSPQVSPVYRDFMGNEYDATSPDVQKEVERQTHVQPLDVKQANREQVADLSKSIDDMLAAAQRRNIEENKSLKTLKDKDATLMQKVGAAMSLGMPGSSPMAGANPSSFGTMSGLVESKDVQELKTARRSMRDAQRIIDEADHNALSGTFSKWLESSFAGGAARGFGQKLFDVETWDMGTTDAIDAMNMMDALKAFDEGKTLTESQQAMLDAKAVELATYAYFGSYVGRGYKAGQVIGENLPFMLEMMLNPASGIGTKAQNMLVRYALKRFGRKLAGEAVKKKVGKVLLAGAKVATRASADLGGAAVMSGTSGIVGVTADAMSRMNGDVQYGTNEEGKSVFIGHGFQKDFSTAFKEAFAARTIENYSEMFGEYFSPLLGIVGKGAKKGLSKIGLDEVNNFVDNVAASDVAKLVSDFERSSKWNGTIREYAEEVVSGIMNALVVGDQTLDTNKDTGVFNLDNNIDTFLGVSLLGGAISSVKTLGYRTPKYEARHDMTMFDKQASQLFGNQDKWGEIRNTIAFGSDEDVKAKIKDVLESPELTREQKLATLQYANSVQKYKGTMSGEKMRREEQDTVRTDMETSFDNGYSLEGQEKNDAKNNLDYQRQRIGEIAADDMLQQLDEDPVSALDFIRTNEDWSDEEKQTAIDYVNAKATYEGMLQRVADDVDGRIAESDRLISERTSKTDGMIHPAVLKAENKQVYIVDGNVMMMPDGSMVDSDNSDESVIVRDAETGEISFVSPADILMVEEALDAEEERQTAQEAIRQQFAQQAADEIEGVLPFNDGDVYDVIDEEGQQHTIEIVPAGEMAGTLAEVQVLVSVDGAYIPIVMSRNEIQNMADAYNLTRLAEYEQAKAARTVEQAEENGLNVQDGQSESDVAPVDDAMPMIGEGEDAEPDFLATTPQRGHQYLYDEAGISKTAADNMVAANISASDKEVKKQSEALHKLEANPGTSINQYKKKQAEITSKLDAAQQALDYWNAVKGEQKMRDDAARRAEYERLTSDAGGRQNVLDEQADMSAKVEAAKQMYGDYFDSDFTVPQDVNELVAMNMPKEKISWEGRDGVRGLQQELGSNHTRGIGKNGSTNGFNTYLAKKGEGISTEEAVHRIWESAENALPNGEHRWDTEEIRGAFIDMFRNTEKPSDIRDYVYNNRVRLAEEMRAAEDEAAEMARIDKEIRQETGMTSEEYQDFMLDLESRAAAQAAYEDAMYNETNISNDEGTEGSTETESTGEVQGQESVETGTEENGSGGVEEVKLSKKQLKDGLINFLDQAGVQDLSIVDRMSEDEMRELDGLINEWEVVNDELGRVIEENKNKVHSKNSAEKKAAQEAIDDARVVADTAFEPVRNYIDALVNRRFVSELKKFYDEYESGDNGIITEGDFIEGARDLMYQHLDPESELYKRLMSAFEDYDDTHNAYLYENGMRDDDGSEAMIEVLRGVVAEAETEPVGETAGTEAESQVPLSDEEVASIVNSMKAHAVVAPTVEITDANWRDNVQTPLGNVKMGANQKEKLFVNGREQQYGMLLETLGNPDIVLEERDKEGNMFHERPSSYLFIKTFQKEDGTKYVHFESVTVSQDGMEVSVSSHIIRENQLRNKLKSDRLLYKATALDEPANSSAEQPTNEGSGLSSEGKGTEKSDNVQENKRKTFDISPLREQYDKLKGLHPDATILFRTGDTYTFVADDANDAANILGITLETDSKGTQFAFIPSADLDKTLPMLVRAGKRVALADGIDYANPVQVAEQETDTNPTEAQKKAGNYKKGHVKIDGYDVTIENPKGSVRSGTDAGGKKWEQTMHNTYGYIRGTEGVDGDHIDVFLSDNPEEGDVYVIDQVNKDGSFDEHKVMYGFNSAEEASAAYLSNYEEGWQGLGTITGVTKDEFKKWVESSHRKTKPFADYKSVKAVEGQSAAPYSIEPTTYTNKKGKETPMFFVKFTSLTKEQIQAGKELAKNSRGWWDREQGGFMMRSEDAAKELAEALGNAEAVTDAQPMSLQDMATATEQTEVPAPAGETAGTTAEGVVTEPQQTEQPKRLVSDERMEELKARLRKKMLGQLNMGVDPEILAIGAELAVGHIERGLTKFADYAKAMIADLGDAIRPYLKSFYNAVRDMPEAEEYVEQMDSYDDVRTFDVLSLTDGETAGLIEKAEEIAKEQDAEEQAEVAKGKLTEQRNDGRKVQSEGVALDGTPLRSFKDEDLDDVNTKYYYQGKRVYVMLITRSGEQVGAMQFTQPRVERLHLSNGQSVNAEDMMVADETKEPVGNDDVQKILDIAKKGKKTSKSKKKDVTLQQEPSFLGDLFGDKTEDNGHERTDATRTEGLPANSTDVQGSAGGRSETSGQGSERPDGEREGSGVRTSGRPVGRLSRLEENPTEKRRPQQPLERPANPKNLRNNHAERGKDYAPKGVDARIEANIKAIELMQQLIESGEQATPEQMAVLRQFSGWGGLGKAFNATEGRYGVANELNKRIRQLLGEEAYNQAVMSRNSAYFTPAVVIDTLWDIARAMGFQGGNVLEGSAGIGDIIGHMPTDISERSDIHAVEIDQTTGNILSLLYPDAHVDVQGFEATQVQNGSVDLAITNVPFVTGLRVNDTTGDKDLSKKFHDIHDFCIAKNVRKLREGGIGIFITSSGTLDNSAKLREWLVQEGGADVVGAFRMHNETFGGTGATSDIIVIRKRVNGKKSQHAIDVLSTTGERTADYDTGEFKRVKGEEIPVIKHMSMDYNSYFVEHPEMMAGEMHFGFEMGDTFRPTSKALYPIEGKRQDEMLKSWAESFAEKDWEADGQPMSSKDFLALLNNAVYDTLGEGVKEGSMVLDSKGELCVAQRGKAVPLGLNANKVKGHTKAECFEAYQSIKKALADLLQYQTEEEDDAGLQPLLKALNKAYDDFVKTYGHLHKNTSISFLKNDVDFANILALEKFSERGDAKGNKIQEYGKTDIFSQRVVEKEKAPEPKNVNDSIIASIYVHGRIDLPWIVDKLNGDDGQHTEESVKAEIIASGLGFENPATRQMEVSYEYLSGNVREKLAIAQANNSDGQYDANIKALEAVIPMNIPAHLIDFSLGSSWIEPKLFEEYVKEKTDVEVSFTSAGGTWYMKAPYWVNEQKNRALGVVSEMFHKTIMGTQLIEAAMQNKTITVSEVHKDRYGSKTINDPAATQACANRIDELRQDFKEWARAKMQGDAELSERIERIYNEMFNNYVPKSIPDEFVPAHFGGAATTVDGKPFALRPHQGKAVVRGTTQPLLLAHEVGSGKTYTLISTAMEMRRLGTARKPMIVVQNATVGQFVESAKKLYPNAKVLTLDDKDHTVEGRKNFYAKIKYNDWDMIVVPQSVFERIPDSEERQMKFVQDKIDEKLLVLEQMRDADGGGKSMIVRQAEKEIGKLEDVLAELTDAIAEKRDARRRERYEKKTAVTIQNAGVKALEMLDRQTDEVENFDDMGIDALLVDEAHEYKHLGFATAMQRGVKGVDSSYSKKAQGVYLKTQAVLEKNNGRNVIFATGTPISNTAAEIWTFMRYLMPADTMKEYGIFYFDDFVRNFGNLTQMLEFTTSGKFKENNRFAGYINLPELVRIWSGIADTVLNKDIEAQRIAEGGTSKIPEMETGKAQDIYLPQTRALRSIMKYVKRKLEEFDKMSGKEKKKNSHIPLTMYGIAKAAAVDARLVMSDAEDDPNSKTNEAVRQILKSLKETASYKGTVAVFADNYQNKHSGFNLYEDIREKLIAKGVPAEQIVVMKSGMTVKKKLEIFDMVNRGDVRVIMGSTFTLGTGVNIQERLHTLIHLDAPNRPMDYTQRNGRILRQGNIHKDMDKPVRVLRFGVEDSLDVTAYQRLKTKGAIADSIMNGKQMMANSMENRALEEEEDVFGDTVAQLSGSEYAMLKNQAEKDVRKYEAKKKQYDADQTYCHNEIPRLEHDIEVWKQWIEKSRRSLDRVNEIDAQNGLTITVGKQTFASIEEMAEFIKEYNKSIKEVENELRDNPSLHSETRRLTVNIGGIDFVFTTEQSIETKQDQGTLFSAVRRKMTYSCEALGLKDEPVYKSLLREGLEHIIENIISGKEFKERIERGERNLEIDEKSLVQVRERYGKPFEFTEELEKSRKRLEEYSELMKKELEEKEKKYASMDAEVDEAIDLTEAEEAEEEDEDDDDSKLYRMREEEPPVRTGIGYKVFVLKDGKLYPPMVANPNGEDTPVGVWLDADAAPVAGLTKTGRQQVKAGGKGTQGGSGMLAYRPGWHLGEIPYALQFGRINPETGKKELFPANFVWAEVEYANDVDYQQEAHDAGVNANGKYQHSLAGLPYVPVNGSYKYRTNPNPETDPWIITGAMKVKRILKPSEVDELVKAAGREPQQREAGAVTDEQVEALNKEIRAKEVQKRFGELNEKYNGKPCSIIMNIDETSDDDFRKAIGISDEMVAEDTPEELHEDILKAKEDIKERKVAGGYSPDTRKIVIFAENIRSLDNLEEGFFHENLHGILHDWYEDGQRGIAERFFDIAQKEGGFVNWDFVDKRYEHLPESKKEEFFVYSLSRAMVQGRVGEILDMLADEDSERVDNILSTIGYDRRTEEASRRAKEAEGGKEVQYEVQRSLGQNDQGLLLEREGQQVLSQEDSLASSRAAGYTKRQHEAYWKRTQRNMRFAADYAIRKLGLGGRVSVLETPEGLKGRKAKAKGWYDAKTGKIVVILSNHGSTSDVIKTVLHEGVAHFGLRKLFGSHFNQFLDNVYQYADLSVRSDIVELAKKHNWDFHTATEEYLARLAEDTNFEKAYKQGWWTKIKSMFLNMLHSIGLADYGGAVLTDNELRYILWRSYENLAEPGMYRNPFRVAEDVVMQSNLGIGNYEKSISRIFSSGGLDMRRQVAENMVAERDGKIHFRDGDFSERDRVTARDEYERMVSSSTYQFREAVQDSMLGLEKLYKAILGKDYEHIENVEGYENAYLAENRMSSVNAAEQHDYYVNFMQPLLEAIGAIAGSKKGARQALTDYMMAKHGLERNLVFAERDAREVEANGGSFADAYNKFRQNDYSGLTALTGESDLSAAEAAAQQIVDDYEAAYDTSDLWNRTREATQATLEKIFRSGLLTKEQYEKIRDMFQYYIPLQGWDETTSDEVYGYLTSRSGIGGSPIKHAVGRSSKADDPIATIAMMADSAIRNGNRNQMKQRFLNFVLNHPSDLVSVHNLWLQYDDTADEWKPVFADIEAGDTAADVERKVEAFEQRMAQLAEAEPDRYKRGRDAKNIPYKVVMGNLKEHQVLVKRGGQTFVLTINGNPRAAQALNGLTNPDVETGGVVGNLLKAGEYINRNLSAFYTTRNPDFVVSNFFRDMLYSNCMTWVKESPRYALRFHKNFGKLNPATMRRLLGKWEKGTLDQSNYTERMFYQFMMNGGETGYTSVLDIEAHKKKVAEELKRYNSVGRKAWAALGLQLDLLNRGVENCARFAAFVTSREMGRSIDRSVYDAKEVSVNFNKKGSGGKMVNATGQTVLGKIGAYIGGGGRLMWVFWNAGVQGMTNFGRAGKRHSGKALAGASAMFILGYVIPQLASLMGGGDGDDDDKNAYYNLPEYVRRSNICFRAGEQWITIPLPIEFRGIYGLGELASGVISGNENYDNKELSYQIASQVSQVLPLDMLEGGGGITPFIPSGVKPFVEAYILNRAWTGLPIYKDTPWNQNEPEWTKAYKNADKTLVGVTKWLNEATGGDDFKKGAIDINPSKLEYLLNGIFGGYANTAGKLKKMGETAFGDREFDWRNILLANRVVKSGDERTANRKLQNEYFKYKKEYDETKRLLKKYENAADEGIAGMAEKVDFIHNSSAYMRYEVFDEYRSDIDDYREDIKNAADDAERRELEAEMYATMRELIDHLHEIK